MPRAPEFEEEPFERTDKFARPKPGSKTQQRGGKIPIVRKNSASAEDFPTSGNEVSGTQDPKHPLNELQRRFVHYTVHHKMGISAALKAAGYSPNPSTGTALMKNPKIIAAIAAEREEYARASGITKKKVIDGMLEAIDMARLKADPLAMIAGWREVGKMCGLYEAQKTKVEVSVNGQVMLQKLQVMSDADLLRLAEGDPSVLTGDFSVIETDA